MLAREKKICEKYMYCFGFSCIMSPTSKIADSVTDREWGVMHDINLDAVILSRWLLNLA